MTDDEQGRTVGSVLAQLSHDIVDALAELVGSHWLHTQAGKLIWSLCSACIRPKHLART